MISALNSEDLADKISRFVNQNGTCLFAGAGVGVQAGMPTWSAYLNHLIKVAESYEPPTAELMKMRVEAKLFPEAAEYYKKCVSIPRGKMYDELASPFVPNKNYTPLSLRPLMMLPFSVVVTTNYDRSLYDAYQNLFDNRSDSGLSLSAPLPVELGDGSMKRAVYWNKFYIARIHGRAEWPDTIVLSQTDYDRISDDKDYSEFLTHIFAKYKCLWMGFSFIDPAVLAVLKHIKNNFPQPYPNLHCALLPENCEKDLITELAKFNIEVVLYKSDSNHKTLWNSIKAAQKITRKTERRGYDILNSIKGLNRYLASCYSRLKLKRKVEPLVEVVAEGIIAQLIFESNDDGVTKDELHSKLRDLIKFDSNELTSILETALDGLQDNFFCQIKENKYYCSEIGQNLFTNDLQVLLDGVVDRLKVREGLNADESTISSIKEILNNIFLVRGWDLGAHFAGAKPASSFNAWDQIQIFIEKQITGNEKSKNALSNSILDLFRHPNDKEATFLADIGRISFGIELTVNNAKSRSSLHNLLPEKLYIDANVLMPAIAEGHPYSIAYADAIRRLQKASRSKGKEVELRISNGFLNEIISHRDSAKQIVAEQGLDDKDRLRRHILYYGADGTNVYVGAYSGWRKGKIKSAEFEDYLNEIAPYSNEFELKQYLKKTGIQTINVILGESEVKLYEEIKSDLYDAYLDYFDMLRQKFNVDKHKPKVLMEHEAKQLTRLKLEMLNNEKSLFLTADRLLLGLCKGEILGPLSKSMVTHLGFLQLIDLIIGLKTQGPSLSCLMWNVALDDKKTEIRNYLIDLALNYYDEAKTMVTWELVDKIAEKASQEANSSGLSLFKNGEHSDVATIAFLDRYEEEFFANMAEILKKREEEWK